MFLAYTPRLKKESRLAPISSKMLKLVSEKLIFLHLDLSTKTVASTSDCSAVMKKIGHVVP